nr:MAG TPA: hypothetical protein [Caudoviricetes sp.]
MPRKSVRDSQMCMSNITNYASFIKTTVPGCLARLRSSLYMVAATSFVSLIALAKINTVTTGHSTLQLAL